MQVCRTDTLAELCRLSPDHAGGDEGASADLLISVTRFFREPRAFDALERCAIRPLFDEFDPEKDEGLRVWVGGLRHRRGSLQHRHPAPGGGGPAQAHPANPDLRDRPRRGRARDGAGGPLPPLDRGRRVRRAAHPLLHRRGHALPRAQGGARVRAVRAPQRAQGPAVHAARPDHLPQPADLSGARAAAAALLDLPLRPEAGAVPVPGLGRDGGRGGGTVRCRSTGRRGSTAPGPSGARAAGAAAVRRARAVPSTEPAGAARGPARGQPAALHVAALERSAPAERARR